MKKNEEKRTIQLFIRIGNKITEAPLDDIRVAEGYYQFSDKGKKNEGKRVTILAKKKRYKPAEEIRVIHVLEIMDKGHTIYLSGPKAIYNEFINDIVVKHHEKKLEPDPFMPETYNGRTAESPGVDFNFEISSYTFQQKGLYKIYWAPGALRSNTLEIEIK